MVKLFNEVLGDEVNLPDRPKRIVSFSPAATETLFKIGAGERLVGVSAFCSRPPEAARVRKVGGYSTVRPELLDELKADLVLTVTGYQRDFAIELSKSRPVYPLELPVTVAGIIDFVVKVGLVVGEPEPARDLANDLLRRLSLTKGTKHLRVYVEIDLGGPVSFGAHSYISDTIRLLGSSSIYDQARCEWLAPDFEFVLAENPDVVFYEAKMYSKFGADDLGRLAKNRDWDGMTAVRRGNLFLTPGPLDFLAHHGPSFVSDAIPWIGKRLVEAAGRT